MRRKTQLQKDRFIDILEENKGVMYKVAHVYTRDAEDLKDLIQEIVIQLWIAFEKYDPTYKVSTWMYRIALNVAISYYRKSSNRKKYISPIETSIVESSEHMDHDLHDNIQTLKALIDGLGELNRALMILYLEGYDHKEIGDILQLSKSNVGTKINRIKKHLRKQFKQLES